MITLKNIVFILLLFLLSHASRFTFDVMSQDDDIGFWNWQGKLGFNKTLLQLTANTDTVWAGMLDTIGIDTALLTGSQESISLGSDTRIRQNGSVTRVEFYVLDHTVIDTFLIRIWRVNFDHTYTLIQTSEDLTPVLVDGLNVIDLTTPLIVRENDFYGVQYKATGNGIAERLSTDNHDSSRVVTSFVTDSASYAWYSQTLKTKFFPIRFYMRAPVIVFLGDGALAGYPQYYNGAQPQYLWQYDSTRTYLSTIEYKIGHYGGWSYQNMCVPTDYTAEELANFNDYVTDLNPALVIINGGVSSLQPASYDTTNWKGIIDSCVAHNFPFVTVAILGWNVTTNNHQKAKDTVNAWLETYTTSNGGIFINARPYVDVERDSGDVGNLWDISWKYVVTDVHFNDAGNSRIAGLIIDSLRAHYYIPNDTAQVYLTLTSLTDTTKDQFPVELHAGAYDYFGLDSIWGTYRIGINGDSVHIPQLLGTDSTGVNYIYARGMFNHNYYGSLAPDTSLLSAGDTIFYTIYTNGLSGSKSISRQMVIATDKSYETEALALFGRFSQKIGTTQKGYMNTLVNHLKRDTLWTTYDVLYVFSISTNKNDALLNWIGDTNNCTIVQGAGSSEPVFIANEGFDFDLNVDNSYYYYISTNFNPTAEASKYSTNSGSFAVYQLTEGASGNSIEDFGGMGVTWLFFSADLNASGRFYGDINSVGVYATNSLTQGLFQSSRIDTSQIRFYKNDSLMATKNAYSTGMNNTVLYVGAANGGAGTPDGYGINKYAIIKVGSGLAPYQIQMEADDFNEYMTSLGKNTY